MKSPPTISNFAMASYKCWYLLICFLALISFSFSGKLLEAKRPRLYWSPCAAHCVDLMLEDIGKIPKVKSALKKCIFMNGYIYSHVSLVNMMRRFTNQRNLHRSAITRFATSFIMLAQFHKQKNILRKMVTPQEWNESKWPKEAGGKKIASFVLQENFWKNVLYALKLTGPLVKVFRIVDGEKKPAMGYIYEAMDRAKEAIAKSFGEKKEHYERAFEFIDAGWNCQLHRPLHAAGHFLNPEIFYDNPTISTCEEVVKGLYDCIARLIEHVEDQDMILLELDAYKNATGLFGHNMAIRQRKTKSPGQTNSLVSVPDLERSMYKVVDGYPCVRLLNLSGEIGCANPGREKVVAPVVRYHDASTIYQLSTILLSMVEIQSFFKRAATDSDFGRNIGGVLIKAENNNDMLKGFSPDEKFPQSKFSPYGNLTYEWNPNGSGIMWRRYNFPVFLLSENNTSVLEEIAAKNEKNNRSYSQDVAEFDLVMQTTKSGTHDSESCLEAGTCLPLGGYSVWSSLPPIIESSSDIAKPVILAMASMDSASFFRDKSLGADSPLSGLVALLAAADALSHSDYLKSFKKQLVFLALTGENWGFLGSRRFLHELDVQSTAVAGLNSTLIETVLEIGSVGKGFNGGVKNFFVHSARETKVANGTFDALQHAKISLKSDHIKISAANTLNPGVPPSSLMSFMNKNSQISGAVLEDFDAMFANEFYHSHLDDISNINTTSIVAAASLIARSLYLLATDMSSDILNLDDIHVNASLVEDLLDCLLKCDPGLSCGLVKDYISPTGTCPGSYVGVIVIDPSSPPYRGYSSDISRFIWNFLAEKTATNKENTSLSCQQGCSNQSVCIRAETDQKGVCVRSTTRYVPAFSTRLQYESGSWKLLPLNSSDSMSMADPVWTESNWDAIGLRVYTLQNAAYDRLILLAGLGITGFSYLAIEIIKTIMTKTLKRD